jgi:hypothetical protein
MRSVLKAVKEMCTKGFAPAIAIETEPGRFQAWVKLTDRPVAKRLSKQAVSVLAGVFPKVSQFGRLAGFTNHKAEKNEAGRHPYTLAHEVGRESFRPPRSLTSQLSNGNCSRSRAKNRGVSSQKQHRSLQRVTTDVHANAQVHAIVEISLDVQAAERMDEFEALVAAEPASIRSESDATVSHCVTH